MSNNSKIDLDTLKKLGKLSRIPIDETRSNKLIEDLNKIIGFIEQLNEVEIGVGELMKDVQPEDLLKFGLIPEFIGRLPIVSTLEDLDEESLIKILVEPKNSLTKQYLKLFEIEGVKLTFAKDALKAVAQKAILRKTGARGLRSIIEEVLLETMFDLPSIEGVEEVILNKEVINGKIKPLLIYPKGSAISSEKEKKIAN